MSELERSNRQKILAHIVNNPGATRKEIADSTLIHAATVSHCTIDLLDEGMIKKSDFPVCQGAKFYFFNHALPAPSHANQSTNNPVKKVISMTSMIKKENNDKDLLTIAEASDKYNIGRKTVWAAVKDGKVRAVKHRWRAGKDDFGSIYMIEQQSLEDWNDGRKKYARQHVRTVGVAPVTKPTHKKHKFDQPADVTKMRKKKTTFFQWLFSWR